MRKLLLGIVLFIATLTSCIKEPEVPYTEIEQRSLRAWMEKYHSDLVDNYQEKGGYYVEVLERGVADSLPISGRDVWVWFDFTARNLSGNVQETRSYELATQLGTYTDYTHYIPAYRFSGKDSHTQMEGTYLATFNKLNIRNQESGQMEEFEVRYGTKLRLYLPSSIVGSTSATNDGGYEGDYSSDVSKPMIVDMHIWGHVNNPVAYEGNRVESFAKINGGLCYEHKAKKDKIEAKSLYRRGITRSGQTEEEVDTRPLEFYDGRWHQPIDTVAHLLVNYTYTPEHRIDFKGAISADTAMYTTESEYIGGMVYTNGVSDVDSRINAALLERFGKGIDTDNILEADSVKKKTTAKVWYIGRFLDGYIFDTNIDEVKEIIYGEVTTPGEALSFNTTNNEENSYILAWEYAIPTLRLGQWAAILTVSTYGYGLSGKIGSHKSTTTTDSSYYDYANYYNYMNYMNSMYGYGYGGMYNSGYYGYSPYYYGYDYTNSSQGTTTTVTTTSSEIQSYAPLLFQIFIEK